MTEGELDHDQLLQETLATFLSPYVHECVSCVQYVTFNTPMCLSLSGAEHAVKCYCMQRNDDEYVS